MNALPSALPAHLLAAVSETLLIPLVARADAHRCFPQLRFRDVYSELLLQALDVDADRYRSHRGSMLGSCLRARWMEDRAMDFLRHRPDAMGVSLGAGLDTMYLRLCDRDGNFNNGWYDVDLPAVIELKRELLTETDRYRMLPADVLDPTFIDRLAWQPGQPAMFLAEGVLMYLERSDVEALLRRLVDAAAWRQSSLCIVFDYCSPLMVRQSRRQPAVRNTDSGREEPQPFRWSLEHPEELCWLSPGVRVVETYDLMRECDAVARLIGGLYRRCTGRLFYGCVQLRFDP